MQPEIGATSDFSLKVYKEPVYTFPVADKGNAAVQSFWGAARDGGRRSHEGIDIFAPRGTPVVAAVEGHVSSTGNRGLGGKQVWLRDSERGNSLYYAHLDSIIARPGMRVSPGDTLGLVGNTGNARTTPPTCTLGSIKVIVGRRILCPTFTSLLFRRAYLLVRPVICCWQKAPQTCEKVLLQNQKWRTRQKGMILYNSLGRPKTGITQG